MPNYFRLSLIALSVGLVYLINQQQGALNDIFRETRNPGPDFQWLAVSCTPQDCDLNRQAAREEYKCVPGISNGQIPNSFEPIANPDQGRIDMCPQFAGPKPTGLPICLDGGYSCKYVKSLPAAPLGSSSSLAPGASKTSSSAASASTSTTSSSAKPSPNAGSVPKPSDARKLVASGLFLLAAALLTV